MIRVLIADDHSIVRDGLTRLINETPGMTVVGETSRGRAALERAQAEDVDVLVLDLSLEDMGGIEVLRRLRELRPSLPVVILSMYPEEQYAVRLLKLGAKAYVSKGRESTEILEAIQQAARGRIHVTSGVNRALLAEGSADPVERLSEREHQIFLLITQGRSPGDIAAELNVAPSTVSTHLVHLREKLGVRTNNELVQYAYRAGQVPHRS